MSERLHRALRAFDAAAFAERHGGYKESRNPLSKEYLVPCPFCRSDRLRWRHDPPAKMAWICWGPGCHRSGDTIELVMALERLERIDAIGYIVDGYVGGDAPTELRELAQVAVPSRVVLERLPVIPHPQGFELLDWRAPAHAPAFAYLIGERGLTHEQIVHYRIGYARAGRLARYVVFPVHMDGGLVYWQARATWDPPKGLSRDQRKAWEKATAYRKTLNPLNEEQRAGASEVLFNYDGARVAEHVVVCEGPIDAIKVGTHAVALFGKVASPTKVERLLRMAARRYTVYLDPGEEERERALALCEQLSDFAPTFVTQPPPGCDPGKLTPAQNAAIIAAAPPYKPTGLKSNLRVR